MMPDAVICSELSKTYDGARALDALSLNVAKGSTYGLIGKNGAGKTTLLKCLMGFLKPDSGSIRVLDTLPFEMGAKVKSRIGYVPQKIELYPWMRVQALVDYVGAFYPLWNAALVARLLAEWDLDPKKKAGALSVGQTQKLAIILALGHEPELLLLDEPAASLDPLARRQFLKTILDQCAEYGCTVVFSTHISSDIERIADRVGILKAGKTIFSGELDALKDSVKKLRIRSSAPLPTQLDIRGILSQEMHGNEAMLTVQHFGENTAARIRAIYSAETAVIDLNLEDIFLSLLT